MVADHHFFLIQQCSFFYFQEFSSPSLHLRYHSPQKNFFLRYNLSQYYPWILQGELGCAVWVRSSKNLRREGTIYLLFGKRTFLWRNFSFSASVIAPSFKKAKAFLGVCLFSWHFWSSSEGFSKWFSFLLTHLIPTWRKSTHLQHLCYIPQH